MSIIIISGNLTEPPVTNQRGYSHLRVAEPVSPSNPYVKGPQIFEVEAPPRFDKIVPTLTTGSAVNCICEQRIEHFTTKSGYPTTRTSNTLLRLHLGPLDQRHLHKPEPSIPTEPETPTH